MNYEVVIGLEIHIQLKTKSKMFSFAPNVLGDAAPNTAIDPVVMGHPGSLPVLNRTAVSLGARLALALNGEVSHTMRFDRKNYFYPDLPKGYQISQLDQPLSMGGHIDFFDEGEPHRVHLERLHLEEDAGKNYHVGTSSLVDFNRAGTPLAEIVTKAELTSPQQAACFLQELRLIARYCGVSDADMEKGQLRCDANISLRKHGEKKLYPKIEVKNINSFKAVEKALAHEIERQSELWDKGEPPSRQETRGWDDASGTTKPQRFKEGSDDYRYFPEPDLPPVVISDMEIEDMRSSLPELPFEKRKRFMDQYYLSWGESDVLVVRKDVADFFEAVISELQDWFTTAHKDSSWDQDGKKLTKFAHSWITSELFKHLKTDEKNIDESRVTSENMAELVILIADGKVNSSAAQRILELMYHGGGDPSDIAEAEGLLQVSDETKLIKIIDEVIERFPEQVQEYKDGKDAVLQFLIGHVMKASRGAANPEMVASLLRREMGEVRTP